MRNNQIKLECNIRYYAESNTKEKLFWVTE